MSNYPPGVSGREYEIAGPDREWEADQPRDCPHCGAGKNVTVARVLRRHIALAEPRRRTVTFSGYRGDVWWICEECGYTVDETDAGPPDRYAEDGT